MSRKARIVRVATSVGALALLLLHLIRPDVRIDSITLGLAVLAVLPWLAVLIESADFPGGWKVKFRELQTEQKAQALDLETLKFLLANFVTDHEVSHLRKLADGEPFGHRKGATSWFLERELRRLRELGFIAEQPGKGIDTLFHAAENSADGTRVDEHFRLTERGRQYLSMRNAFQEGRDRATEHHLRESP